MRKRRQTNDNSTEPRGGKGAVGPLRIPCKISHLSSPIWRQAIVIKVINISTFGSGAGILGKNLGSPPANDPLFDPLNVYSSVPGAVVLELKIPPCILLTLKLDTRPVLAWPTLALTTGTKETYPDSRSVLCTLSVAAKALKLNSGTYYRGFFGVSGISWYLHT